MATDRPIEKVQSNVTARFDESACAESASSSTKSEERQAPAPDFVTERFPEPRATERFQEPRATLRMPDDRPTRRPAAGRARTVALHPGELVGDRYRVEEGPLPGATGEADIFRCVDTETGENVALKFYHENVSPKVDVIKSLLKVNHPHLVTIKSFGTWQGRFYEVMEYCAGGSSIDHAPFDEAMLKVYLKEMVAGLQYLHVCGIVHRDIKPNNLLFRKAGRQELVISDFGVSSLLDAGEDVRMTSTGAFFTLDYAAPELLDGKQVSPKTDYYALGVTLLHLYAGSSPFAGLDKNAILGSHFRGKVPRPPGLSKNFSTLISGLLRVAPEKRWGHRQVTSWLRGELVLTDEGLPDREELEVGKKLPYKNMTAINTPREMLARLGEFNAKSDLQRGFISQWLMYFDVSLGKEVARAEAEFSHRPELGVFKLRYLLDPTQPLEIGERKVYNVEQLVKLIAQGNETDRKNVQDALYSGCIGVWLSALQTDEYTDALVAKIQSIGDRLGDNPLAVFALLYTLNPNQPLAFSNGTSIASPDDFEEVLPAGTRDLTRYLYYGYLREWFIGAFPERQDDIRFLTYCMETYGRKDEEQGLFALRCHFCRSLPFPIGSRQIGSPKELAALIGSDPTFFHNAVYLLSRGWIRTWLVHTGRLGPADLPAFDKLVNDTAASWPRKMEAVLHLLDPELPWPVVACDRTNIYVGGVTPESCKVERVRFFNSGRGYLSGTVALAGTGQGFDMSGGPIEGTDCLVEIGMHGKGLTVGSHQGTTIIATTNGGRLEIPVLFEVVSPIAQCLKRSSIAGLIAGGCMGLLRYALQLLFPVSVTEHVMAWPSLKTAGTGAYAPAMIPLAIVLLSGIAGSVYYLFALDRAIGADIESDEERALRAAQGGGKDVGG